MELTDKQYAGFMNSIDIGDAEDCWEWLRACSPKGYGRLHIAGKVWLAHRLAYALHYKLDDLGESHVLHTCDTRPCCNPSHLRLGRQGNMWDRWRSGRGKHHRAKLTESDVRAIRVAYDEGKTQSAIAAEFGVSQPHISDIYSGKRWGWLK